MFLCGNLNVGNLFISRRYDNTSASQEKLRKLTLPLSKLLRKACVALFVQGARALELVRLA